MNTSDDAEFHCKCYPDEVPGTFVRTPDSGCYYRNDEIRPINDRKLDGARTEKSFW